MSRPMMLLLPVVSSLASCSSYRAPEKVYGTLGTGASIRAATSTGDARWSITVRGSDLLLERNGRRAEVRGAVAGEGIDFIEEPAARRWTFGVPGDRCLVWSGPLVQLGERTWEMSPHRPTRIELGR